MELRLVKENKYAALSLEEIRFNFYKNIIKKDLELACWSNNAVKVFGDFQIYSDYKAELNCFEQIVTFITGKTNNDNDDKLEFYFSSQCIEYFFKQLILNDVNVSGQDLESLSIKFTKYLLEATSISDLENSRDAIHDLDLKYFGASDLSSYNKNTQYKYY